MRLYLAVACPSCSPLKKIQSLLSLAQKGEIFPNFYLSVQMAEISPIPYLSLVRPGERVRRASVIKDQAGQVDGGAGVDVQVASAKDLRAGLCPWAAGEASGRRR